MTDLEFDILVTISLFSIPKYIADQFILSFLDKKDCNVIEWEVFYKFINLPSCPTLVSLFNTCNCNEICSRCDMRSLILSKSMGILVIIDLKETSGVAEAVKMIIFLTSQHNFPRQCMSVIIINYNEFEESDKIIRNLCKKKCVNYYEIESFNSYLLLYEILKTLIQQICQNALVLC